MRSEVIIDFRKLENNINVVRSVIPKDCDIIAVVKANGYGHGDVAVAKHLEKMGIHRFAVACMYEARILRAGGVKGEIIILSYVSTEDVIWAANNNVLPAVVSMDHAKELSEFMSAAMAKGAAPKLKCHLKINTGMNRVGFDCRTQEELEKIASVYSLPGLDFRGIFSHFSSSDDTSEEAGPYTLMQLERYNRVLSFLDERGINPGLRHISNSGAIGKYPQARFDAVRSGGLTYGYNTAFDAPLPVEPILEWKSEITCIRTLSPGDCVSYGRHFKAEGPVRIATIGTGYADGYKRTLSNKGCVLVNGCRAPIRGNICMDQMMIDITGIPDVKPGDDAVLIGKSGDLKLTADDLGEMAGSCMHDILSTISPRVMRTYINE